MGSLLEKVGMMVMMTGSGEEKRLIMIVGMVLDSSATPCVYW